MFKGLINILESFLGPSYGDSNLAQQQFDCPQCSEENGELDGKHNLEISLTKNVFRCWKCEHTNEMSGKLSKLIKRYGNEEILQKYRNEVSNIKKSKEYELNFFDNDLIFEEDEDFKIKLPEKTYNFKFDGNKKEEKALNYLKSRGLNKQMIDKYNLMYTDWDCPNWNFKYRIIIPSYDKYNELNYYTGRDYNGKSNRKYYNMENSNRKEIIFNEKLINWDGDIVLVEGPFDHLVVPNSIPLLGKVINQDFYLFNKIIKESTQKIIIFLDDDATLDSINLCERLSCFELCGRLKIVPTKNLLQEINTDNHYLNLKKLDPGSLYELKGPRGISWALKRTEDYECI